MCATRFSWRLPIILAGFGLGYLVFMDGAPDLTEDLRSRLRTAPGSVYRVIYLEDIARDYAKSDWSIACVVAPYADDRDKAVPKPLKQAWWVGSWDESEWRIALLDHRSLVQFLSVQWGPFKLREQDPSGIKRVPRPRNPVLRVARDSSGIGPFVVELGLGDARPSQ
jgi:hypothetical protein